MIQTIPIKELQVENATLQACYFEGEIEVAYYCLTFTYSKKLIGVPCYYKAYSGTIEKGENNSCTAIMLKKHSELPRSIHPILSLGYIVVVKKLLGFEIYQSIKKFAEVEPLRNISKTNPSDIINENE